MAAITKSTPWEDHFLRQGEKVRGIGALGHHREILLPEFSTVKLLPMIPLSAVAADLANRDNTRYDKSPQPPTDG